MSYPREHWRIEDQHVVIVKSIDDQNEVNIRVPADQEWLWSFADLVRQVCETLAARF